MPEPILPDLLAPGLKLVFCGTAPSRASARAQAYYGNPGNFFWDALLQIGLTPRRFQPKEYPALLPLGIGLTDLNKTEVGSDHELSDTAFDCPALFEKIARFGPRALAFTSKNAGGIFLGSRDIDFGEQPAKIGDTRIFVLPSPSGRARSHWDVRYWKEAAKTALP
ncbi:MAG: mismatch-specific DNA-glycosylase [Alphaproteobacteria bacterium]|nr:mismatch-specific DNA-glycosylase [Alphaproteobacteria bacterium]